VTAQATRAPARAGLWSWAWIAGPAALALPWLAVRFSGAAEQASPLAVSVLAGVAVLGAAFILSWAAEAI
jgi:hypothetical protein